MMRCCFLSVGCRGSVAIILCGLLLTTSCMEELRSGLPKIKSQQERDINTQLKEMYRTPPLRRLVEAINDDDWRFYAVVRNGREVPGVYGENLLLVRRFGVFIIPHTTATPDGELEKKLQEKAFRYAFAYNRLLLERIKKEKASSR